MFSRTIRVAAFVVVSLFLATGVSFADVILEDADTVTSGDQGTRDLGNVGPGAIVPSTASFRLGCDGNKHVDHDQSVTLAYSGEGSTIPVGGAASATSATIGPIPLAWPDDGTQCGSPAPTPLSDNGDSTVTLTAPSTPGTYTYKLKFNPTLSTIGDNDNSSITGSSFVEYTLTVVDSANTAPTVTSLTGPTDVDEHATTERTYSFAFTDPDEDEWSFDSGYPTCGTGALVALSASIDQENKTGEFKCIFDDGPASPTVAVKISDGTDESNEATLAVTVNNVAPTVSSFTGPSNALVGDNVTFTASATDPSGADTTAGFTWAFDTGLGFIASGSSPTTTTSFSTSFSTCGTHTISAQAMDKDDDVSVPASATVAVWDAHFLAPLIEGEFNLVQKGRVVPVKIDIGCGGFQSGLSPQIQLLKGDKGGDEESGDNVITESVSNADTTGIMREVDGKYLYNLAIPKSLGGTALNVGDFLTVRVRPFGGTNPSMYIVLKIRK